MRGVPPGAADHHFGVGRRDCQSVVVNHVSTGAHAELWNGESVVAGVLEGQQQVSWGAGYWRIETKAAGWGTWVAVL